MADVVVFSGSDVKTFSVSVEVRLGIGIYDETVPKYIAGILIVDGSRKPVEENRYLILHFDYGTTHTFDLEVPQGYDFVRWDIYDWDTGEKVDESTVRPYSRTLDTNYYIHAVVQPAPPPAAHMKIVNFEQHVAMCVKGLVFNADTPLAQFDVRNDGDHSEKANIKYLRREVGGTWVEHETFVTSEAIDAGSSVADIPIPRDVAWTCPPAGTVTEWCIKVWGVETEEEPPNPE